MKTKYSKVTKPKNKISDFVTFIILCDIPGYRMKSYGPSCLLQIGNHRLIDLQLKNIQSLFENYEIILCIGFDAELTIKYIRQKHNDQNIRIIENQLYEKYNSCESLRLSLNNTNNSKYNSFKIECPLCKKKMNCFSTSSILEKYKLLLELYS